MKTGGKRKTQRGWLEKSQGDEISFSVQWFTRHKFLNNYSSFSKLTIINFFQKYIE